MSRSHLHVWSGCALFSVYITFINPTNGLFLKKLRGSGLGLLCFCRLIILERWREKKYECAFKPFGFVFPGKGLDLLGPHKEIQRTALIQFILLYCSIQCDFIYMGTNISLTIFDEINILLRIFFLVEIISTATTEIAILTDHIICIL